MGELVIVVISIPSLALSATKSLPFEGKYKTINDRTTTAAIETKTRVIKLILAMSAHVEDSLQ
jgi:hypothetical protein